MEETMLLWKGGFLNRQGLGVPRHVGVPVCKLPRCDEARFVSFLQ